GLMNLVAFQPGGRYLATADPAGGVSVWEVATRKRVWKLEGHTAVVTAAVFSPDGKRLATQAHDHTVRVWELDGGKEAFLFPVPRVEAQDPPVSPPPPDPSPPGYLDKSNGKAATGNAAAPPLAFSPDGTRLATRGINYTMMVWDLNGGKRPVKLVGHTARVLA